MPFPLFDRSRLHLKPLRERVHDFHLSEVRDLGEPVADYDHPGLDYVAEKMRGAKETGAPILILMGAHPIKNGLSRYFIDLMEKGFPVHIAMNGAGPIHDFELALIGATTESVARYIKEGQFGLWQETGLINEAIHAGYRDGLGMGEAIGRAIEEHRFPHRDVSILATAYRLGIPVTVHIGIGYDIIHEHPNCDGAALGATSYRDFLILCQTVFRLQSGVVLNIGSQVMGPEVFLKALAMARNVAHQEGRRIDRFTVGVFDMAPLPDPTQEPPKTEWAYYFRPLKTLLVRTVAGGGHSFYFPGDHRVTIPNLHKRVMHLLESKAQR